MVLTSFIKELHDAQLRWELRKIKPASPDGAAARAVELNAFMQMETSFRGGSQATVSTASAIPAQPLMATTPSSE